MTDFDGITNSSVAGADSQPGAAGQPDDAGRAVAQQPDAVVRRTKDGWRVGDSDVADLTSAMALADLISAELDTDDEAARATTAESVPPAPATRKRGKNSRPPASETGRLRATIGQLEHALTARIRVEQAIGVLAERHRIQPRQAFEQLRNAARSRGRRVIDIASDVVASATNPLLQLPDELSRPRSGGRRNRRTPGVLGSK
jgi:ANTAR domain-containing protein